MQREYLCYYLIAFFALQIKSAVAFTVHEVYLSAGEVFNVKLSTDLFNLTDNYFGESHRFYASLAGHGDLPNWCHFAKSSNFGFLYGLPPEETSEVLVTAMNEKTFETSSIILRFIILPKLDPTRYEVQLKVNNFDIGDFLAREGISQLLNIFLFELWPEASQSLRITYLSSALDHGARKPLKQSDGEGVYLSFGSSSPFSEVLIELQREVGPLWSSRPCPRDFKKTSLEKNFRSRGYILDWCSFRLVTCEDQDDQLKDTEDTLRVSAVDGKKDEYIWVAPAKDQLPKRSYIVDSILAIFSPIVFGIILLCVTSLVLTIYPPGDKYLHDSEVLQTTSVHNNNKDADSSHELSSVPSRHLSLPLNVEGSISRRSSPFCFRESSNDGEQSPYSTLSRSGNRGASMTPYGTLARQLEARASTLNRPEPPPYGSLRANQ
ncbi:alpha-sarcoglycan-like isoform X2 [Artemia franciscana]|uniref:alpha-sarcoglycan-like isoform X2 n=1 Tax=Artemia franciscana TaxID=6661 RepID=UPI0032D9BC75